jgi:RNA polymerase sigma-70 factor, ECF subfamily
MDKNERNKSDNRLIQGVLSGEKHLFSELINRNASMVFHIVRRFEKDPDESEELAQQIFVKAYEKLNSFNENAKFSTWLYRLAMNHCMDYAKNIRRQNQRFSELEEDFSETVPSEQQTPYLKLEMKEWKRVLELALGKLSNNYSEPFLMKYRDGLSYQVMAEQTGLTVSALKVRVHRARKELKDLLQKEV